MRAAARPCTYPGCSTLVHDGGGRCIKHPAMVEQRRDNDRQRGGSTARGYGYKWQKASKAFITAHPLCQCNECDEGKLRVMISTVVDHRIPHRGDMKLFWDSSNWQSMSKPCHDKKTALEDGAFGHQRQPGGCVTISQLENL